MKRFTIQTDEGDVIDGVMYDDGYVHVRARDNVMSMSLHKDVWDVVKDSFFNSGYTYKEVD